jgi:hypothetical protein
MNIHIELVKKWLADPTSVTQQELKDNRAAAYAVYAANGAAYYAYYAAYAAADEAVYAANGAANGAAYAATKGADYADAAKYWVKRYEELTK